MCGTQRKVGISIVARLLSSEPRSINRFQVYSAEGSRRRYPINNLGPCPKNPSKDGLYEPLVLAETVAAGDYALQDPVPTEFRLLDGAHNGNQTAA
jgi:hypothetical protein